jgi:hypothetical protein
MHPRPIDRERLIQQRKPLVARRNRSINGRAPEAGAGGSRTSA